jgi:hypothetical protein
VRVLTIRAMRKPRPFIVKALADVAAIVQRRIHLCNFVGDGSEVSESGNWATDLPVEP